MYPVDKSRINEFGFSAESDAETDGEHEVENEINEDIGSGEGEVPAVPKTLERAVPSDLYQVQSLQNLVPTSRDVLPLLLL